MSTEVYAFIEVLKTSGWVLFQDFEKPHHQPPYNLAPFSWGDYNFTKYYEASGEKGFPKDLSCELKQIIQGQQHEWGVDAINRPSWMTITEVLSFYQSDNKNQYAHFDIDFLMEINQQELIRVVFWST